jgi:hypothetical protein
MVPEEETDAKVRGRGGRGRGQPAHEQHHRVRRAAARRRRPAAVGADALAVAHAAGLSQRAGAPPPLLPQVQAILDKEVGVGRRKEWDDTLITKWVPPRLLGPAAPGPHGPHALTAGC